LRAGFAVELRARGGSMWPLLRTGDWIRVEPALPGSLRRGDIVVIDGDNGLVAHRAVAVDPLITRGDRMAANDVADNAALVGRVRSFRRGAIAIDLDGALGGALSRLSASRIAAAAASAKTALGACVAQLRELLRSA
jgi:hypothetical protein